MHVVAPLSLLAATALVACAQPRADTGAPPVSPGQASPDASCAPRMFLAPIRQKIKSENSNVAIRRVEVERCRGGYAQVFAVPVERRFETEQFFLRHEADRWSVITYGTGITCYDSDLFADLRRACRALGYPRPE